MNADEVNNICTYLVKMVLMPSRFIDCPIGAVEHRVRSELNLTDA